MRITTSHLNVRLAVGVAVLGMFCACATPTTGMAPPAVASAAPTLTPRELRKLRRFTSPAMVIPPLGVDVLRAVGLTR